MKKIILLWFLASSILTFSQTRIYGKITNENNVPLEGASVYINNTSLGTTSNIDGNFFLDLPQGEFDLIVSFIGYETIRYSINTFQDSKPITFTLIPKRNRLDEIVIQRRKKMTTDQRNNYLRLFRRVFLGTSKIAKDCKILNEKAIQFDYDPSSKILEVSANEPLKIFNKQLGYNLSYDLVNLEISEKNVTYLGYVLYEERNANGRKKKRWNRNRRRTYKGSSIHFLKAVRNNEVQKQGYMVDLIERKPNPQYPTPEEIKFAAEVFTKRRTANNIGYLNSTGAKKDFERAKKIYDRAELSPFIEVVLKRNAQRDDYILEYDGKFVLSYKNYLRVTYLRELPDKNYYNARKSRYQVSLIKLFKEEVELDSDGILKDPLDILQLGYWAFEKVGDQLPIDFIPASRGR